MILSALLVMSLLLAACGPFGGDDGDEEGDVPEQPEETAADENGEDEASPTTEEEATPEDEEAAEGTPEEVSEEIDGEQIYLRECAACHGEDGEGNEQSGSSIPPHNGNGLVTAEEPAGVISVVLTGRGGMPRFNGILSDEELAAVITYMRSAWDNDASAVEPETIDEVRQEVIGDEDTEEEEDAEGEGDDEGDETQGAGDQEEDEDAEVTPTEEGEGED